MAVLSLKNKPLKHINYETQQKCIVVIFQDNNNTLKNTKTLVGIVRIELTKDLHNPFSSKELLERQDC